MYNIKSYYGQNKQMKHCSRENYKLGWSSRHCTRSMHMVILVCNGKGYPFTKVIECNDHTLSIARPKKKSSHSISTFKYMNKNSNAIVNFHLKSLPLVLCLWNFVHLSIEKTTFCLMIVKPYPPKHLNDNIRSIHMVLPRDSNLLGGFSNTILLCFWCFLCIVL